MAPEEGLSIIALVISLVALIVASGQTLQQYFSTAEGYRRCAPSVIGPWARLRGRRWIWSEFRFETTFVSPHIVCVTPSELRTLKRSTKDERAYRIASRELATPDHARGVLNRTVHDGIQNIETPTRVFCRKWRESDFEKLQKPSSVLEKDHSLYTSWIELIRRIHDFYVSYWPDDCVEECLRVRRVNIVARRDDKDLPLHRLLTKRTDGVVVYRKWTWDFTPPGLTKPLATSTVRDVILVGLRLGMQWRALDVGNRRMAADGTGCSFEVFDIRGLGMVLNFTVQSPAPPPEPLKAIPSRGVDTLLFGILPGDPILVCRNIPMVTDDRKVQLYPPRLVFDAIGLSYNNPDKYHSREITNEVISLLCSFLPLIDCSELHLPGTILREVRYGAFHHWEGRYALLKTLGSMDRTPNSAIDDVYETLTVFESRFEADFYDRWGETVKEVCAGDTKGQLTTELRLQIIQQLEEMVTQCWLTFTNTTEWFLEHGFNQFLDPSSQRDLDDDLTRQHGPSGPRTMYMKLVAAHAYMADFAHKACARRREERQQIDTRGPEGWREYYTLPEGKFRKFDYRNYDFVEEYATIVQRDDNELVRYMQEGEPNPYTAAEIRDAWWMLMLRGVVWDFCLLEGGNFDVDQLVPSHLFDNKTPVWIT